jgi:thiol-disulfide isomerase/thioredoxin
MKRTWLVALVIVIALAPAAALGKARKALCAVCATTQGEKREEAVEAVRSFEGREYAFCSKGCAEAFDADPAAYLPPVLPRPAPSWAVTELGGAPVAGAGLRGKVVLVDFWATWCAPCVKSMPRLDAIHRELGPRGFSVVGISIDEDEGAVRTWVASRGITYPIAVDSKDAPAWSAFRVKVVPSAYLVDREGSILAQWTGTVDPKEIEAKVREVLGPDAAGR